MNYELARTFNWGAFIVTTVCVLLLLWSVVELRKNYKEYKKGFSDPKKARLKQWFLFELGNNLAAVVIIAFMSFVTTFAVASLPYTLDKDKAINNIQKAYGITVEHSEDKLICDYFAPDFDCINRFEYKVLDSEKAPEVILVEFEEYKEPKIIKRYSITEENID